MPRVMIRCPNTGQAVPTGMEFDTAVFAGTSISNNAVQCPACGKMHRWSKKDAWLEGTDEIRRQSFADETVDIDGKRFFDCKFTRCKIRFSGTSASITLQGCTFTECSFEFAGPAAHTVSFLKAMYWGLGDWGKGSVEKLFEDIRRQP